MISHLLDDNDDRPLVVVVGGGFGGLNAVRTLDGADAQVLLIDRHNYHLFQPLLYQVATAELAPNNIAAPLRKTLDRQKDVRVALGDVAHVDLEKRSLTIDGGTVEYDYLILAVGMEQSYFGHDDFRMYAQGLKTIDDALGIRRRMLLAFEEAEWEADEEERRAKLTFVIVGGGPTGVELAGAIKDVASKTLPKDFRAIDPSTARVVLVHSGSRLVETMPEDLARKAQQALEDMGVEILLESRVTRVDHEGVYVGDRQVPAENVFWATGVQGPAVAKTLGVELDKKGRVLVNPDLSIPNHPEVFVVGDAAAVTNPDTGQPVPGVAQAAIQMGRFAANVIRRELSTASPGKRPAFHYNDKGSMAVIGRGRAIAAFGNTHVSGFIGWIVWSLVHVFFLVGFGNRLLVMGTWLWDFLRHSRKARLITGDPAVHIKAFRETHHRKHHSPE